LFEFDSPTQQLKFELLNLSLMLNEYKDDDRIISVGDFKVFLENYMHLVDLYIKQENINTQLNEQVMRLLGINL
jgi:hypothetical protein